MASKKLVLAVILGMVVNAAAVPQNPDGVQVAGSDQVQVVAVSGGGTDGVIVASDPAPQARNDITNQRDKRQAGQTVLVAPDPNQVQVAPGPPQSVVLRPMPTPSKTPLLRGTRDLFFAEKSKLHERRFKRQGGQNVLVGQDPNQVQISRPPGQSVLVAPDQSQQVQISAQVPTLRQKRDVFLVEKSRLNLDPSVRSRRSAIPSILVAADPYHVAPYRRDRRGLLLGSALVGAGVLGAGAVGAGLLGAGLVGVGVGAGVGAGIGVGLASAKSSSYGSPRYYTDDNYYNSGNGYGYSSYGQDNYGQSNYYGQGSYGSGYSGDYKSYSVPVYSTGYSSDYNSGYGYGKSYNSVESYNSLSSDSDVNYKGYSAAVPVYVAGPTYNVLYGASPLATYPASGKDDSTTTNFIIATDD